jgi:LPS-assembly protein
MRHRATAVCLAGLLTAVTTHAQSQTQDAPRSDAPPSLDEGKLPDLCQSIRYNFVGDKEAHFTGTVFCKLPDNGRISAEQVDAFTRDGDTHIVAEGNVVFTGPDGNISAERLEYNATKGTGVFTIAHGFLNLGPGADPRQFIGQTPEVEFRGRQLEKTGPGRFRITRGEWTTCLQPTPRWEFVAGSAEIKVDHYVTAKSTILRVKGVPLFWLPYFYYPIQHDDRATGFLLPTIGASTYLGQAFSNAFFWAIDRSQDATFFHDWFTRAGQGAGAEYRYVASPQSSGTFRFYRFLRNSTSTLAGGQSYQVTGNAIQMLSPHLIARARIDYFSDPVDQQLLHQTLAESSQSNRLIEGGLTATHGAWSGNLLYQRNDVINSQQATDTTQPMDDTIVYGSEPRLNAVLSPQRLFGSPVYASFNTDVGYLPYRHMRNGVVEVDNSFGRFDASPSVRIPFSRLSFLSINTSAAYRTTYYTRHADETTGQIEDGSFFRQYATVRTDIVGPVFAKIFDVHDSSFAERVKHIIEPAVSVDFTSAIDDYQQTPIQTDVSDKVVGGTTRVTYGITNRLFSRKPTVNKVRGATREFLTIGVQQTAYSNSEASRYDATYSSTVANAGGQTLSPVTLTARVSPSGTFDGNVRAEYDVENGLGLQSFTTGASVNYARGGLTLNYSRQRFDSSQLPNSFVSASARTNMAQNRITGTYSISLDIEKGYIVSQGVIASYMAQCCGIQGEYHQFNYPSGYGLPINSDRRVNFAFVLAGLGTFSNFFGAFGGR